MTYDPFVRESLPPPELLPEFRFDLPELRYPQRLNAAAELLKGGARDSLAFVNGHGRWTYGELDALSGRIARLLVEQEGLVPGNRVLLRGPNTMTMFAAWLGVLKAGGVVVATMPLLRPGEIAAVIEPAEISHAIVDSRFIGDFREAAEQTHFVRSIVKYDGDFGKGELEERSAALDPLPALDTGRDDPALIAFTSGTTGVPKGCVQFHRDVLAPCDSFARHLIGMKPGDIALTSAPLAFTFGLGAAFLFPLRAGAACATIEQASPPLMLEAIAKFGVTHLGTAPTAYKAMLATEGAVPKPVRPEPVEGLSLSSDGERKSSPSTSSGRTEESALALALRTLRYCLSAGEHLPQATWHTWKERTGIAITDGIGSTEMMHIFIAAAGDEIRPGATGKAVPGYEATVLDADGNPMAEGTGRLAVKGPTGCRYLDDPRQRDYVQDGWNVTGDTYRRDPQGYYWYLARSDDMIVSSGYNIGAPEVENALLSHPAVAECAVIGVGCEERGQKVKAFVVPAAGVNPSDALLGELQAHAKAQIAPYKYPREVEFVDALPKTATGKLRRGELRNRPASGE
ncbi:MAG TPA: AMP-binding protein [Sphingomicrobium sp.]|nr:AMP-binding protein [Sphingomicrobium sp.]